MSLAPLALMTAFFALAPATVADQKMAVFGVCIAVGLLATLPGRLTVLGVFGRALYAWVMLNALVAWMIFVLPSYFPDEAHVALRGIDL